MPINLNCDPRNVVLAMEIPHIQTLAPGKKKIADRVKIKSGNTVRWHERAIVELVTLALPTIPPPSPPPQL